MKKIASQKGFTIIETLVAITILMISIVGPLTIAHKGLLASIYARDQITASFLAQDALEFLKNMRDNNINRGAFWLSGMESCATTLVPQAYCVVDTLLGSPMDPAIGTRITSGIPVVTQNGLPRCTDTRCRLRVSPNGYDHTNGDNTQFYRYFYLVPNSGGGENGGGSNTEAKLLVVVRWSNGLVDSEVVYENEIFNVLK